MIVGTRADPGLPGQSSPGILPKMSSPLNGACVHLC